MELVQYLKTSFLELQWNVLNCPFQDAFLLLAMQRYCILKIYLLGKPLFYHDPLKCHAVHIWLMMNNEFVLLQINIEFDSDNLMYSKIKCRFNLSYLLSKNLLNAWVFLY